MTVGERIKMLRKKLGLNQVEFADKINVSKQTLYKYENNLITNIPSDKIESVAKLCHVSPAYIMGWEDEDGLTKRDNKDIAKDLDDIMSKIENGEDGPLRYNGEEIDEESLALLKDAIGMSLRHLKIVNKEKYNPYKNKK